MSATCGQIYEQRQTGELMRVIHIIGESVTLAPLEALEPLIMVSFDELSGAFCELPEIEQR